MTIDRFYEGLTTQLRLAEIGRAKLDDALLILSQTDDPLSSLEHIAAGRDLLINAVHEIFNLIDRSGPQFHFAEREAPDEGWIAPTDALQRSVRP